jgi:poly(glycerol-phosphate) alpha-glucosyltransferase
MVVLEAWAYGKPVLMTPECNLPEGFAANAAIRIETSVESIAAGLRQLFELGGASDKVTDDKREAAAVTREPVTSDAGIPALDARHSSLDTLGANGRELVRARFTWPKIAADLRGVYAWLLGKGTRPECVRVNSEKLKH